MVLNCWIKLRESSEKRLVSVISEMFGSLKLACSGDPKKELIKKTTGNTNALISTEALNIIFSLFLNKNIFSLII